MGNHRMVFLDHHLQSPAYLHAQLIEDKTSRVVEEPMPFPAELHRAIPVVMSHCGGQTGRP